MACIMVKKQKLLTYNAEKSPLVEQFFNSLDRGMQSHYMREAIEFYIKYKDKVNHINSDLSSESFSTEKPNVKNHEKVLPKRIETDSEYEEFNPNNF